MESKTSLTTGLVDSKVFACFTRENEGDLGKRSAMGVVGMGKSKEKREIPSKLVDGRGGGKGSNKIFHFLINKNVRYTNDFECYTCFFLLKKQMKKTTLRF